MLINAFSDPCGITNTTSCVPKHSFRSPALEFEGEQKVSQGQAILSASISSTNWQKITSLFASYVPVQQARLSHYGGGKSSSIEVETPLICPPLPELGMNSPPQSQTTVLFISLLFRRCLVYSVRSTFLSVVFSFCLVLLHGWISFVLPAEIVHGGKWPKWLRMQPPFCCMNVHL